ncbi:MAG: sulfur carrier protein ThiS [Phycisphaeraceae bacterium]|nr:sulfur carrier protein ThiS [Phycisphaeraceae bacterium]
MTPDAQSPTSPPTSDPSMRRPPGGTIETSGDAPASVRLNGSTHRITPGLTVAALLDRLGQAGRPCAVEVNGSLVPFRHRQERILLDGDRIEIVTLVGGG